LHRFLPRAKDHSSTQFDGGNATQSDEWVLPVQSRHEIDCADMHTYSPNSNDPAVRAPDDDG